MNINHKGAEIQRQAIKTMRHYLDKVIVPIVLLKDGRRELGGTGTLLKINSEYFIVTAGHIIEDAEVNHKSILLAKSGPTIIEPTEIRKSGYVYDRSSGIDVGYIEISNQTVVQLQKNNITTDRFCPNTFHLEDDAVLVCGYPKQLVSSGQDAGREILTVTAIHCETSTIDPGSWPKNKNKEVHILLEYREEGEDADGNTITIPDAPGISGGGIWVLQARKKKLWSAEYANLIGIQSLWHSEKRYLVGIQIQHWIDLLRRDYPSTI